MGKKAKRRQRRFNGMTATQIVILFVMGFAIIAAMGSVAVLISGNFIPGIVLPGFGTSVPAETYLPTSTVATVETATMPPFATRTALPTMPPSPSRTKATTWTLLPELITPSATPIGYNPPTLTRTRTSTPTGAPQTPGGTATEPFVQSLTSTATETLPAASDSYWFCGHL